MLAVDEIIRTAVREHDFGSDKESRSEALARLHSQVAALRDIPTFRPEAAKQLSIVKFRCMLQDTGYPLEVYMPAFANEGDADNTREDEIDWSKLQERWVGWGVQIPGEQAWAAQDDLPQLQDLAVDDAPARASLPLAVHDKYPLANVKGRYTGALIKICDPSTSFRPGTAYTFTGIVSSSQLPSNGDEDYAPAYESATPPVVPVLHVIAQPEEAALPHLDESVKQATAEVVIDYLAHGFSTPDPLAAEFLLLALIASVTSRIPGGLPLGSLSLNLLFPKGATDSAQAFPRLANRIAAISPRVVPVDLSLDLLNSRPIHPVSSQSASSSSLQSGLLQLAPSTAVLLNEDTLESGELKDRGVRNLRTLSEIIKTQHLRYEYPFTDEGFGMEVDLSFIVCGVGKSLLPVDLHVPLRQGSGAVFSLASTSSDLPGIRSFLAQARASTSSLTIPDEVAEYIQSDFVRLRKKGFGGGAQVPTNGNETKADTIGKRTVSEEDLKRWMKLARLLALTTPDKTLSKEVWDRTLRLDAERLDRLDVR